MRKFSFKEYYNIQSSFMESYVKELWKALKNLTKLLHDNDISFTIIGGAARNQYGFLKTTEDVDIVVAKADKEKMLHLPIGYIREVSHGRGKVFFLHNPKIKIEVIYEDEISGDGKNGLKYENPKMISNYIHDTPFLPLEKLIEYKLSSGIYGNRMKDFTDIIELIRANKLDNKYAEDFREDLKNKYIELWNMARIQIDNF